jgi:hypothetical protein
MQAQPHAQAWVCAPCAVVRPQLRPVCVLRTAQTAAAHRRVLWAGWALVRAGACAGCMGARCLLSQA